MTLFANTPAPTPFGVFDADTQFQTDADSMVLFVKRKLGDDVSNQRLITTVRGVGFRFDNQPG